MKKKKMQAMMAAGPHIPVEVATALIDEIDASDPDSGMGDFGKGAAAALAFLSCGPESRMHGARFADFMANAKAISDRAAEPPEGRHGGHRAAGGHGRERRERRHREGGAPWLASRPSASRTSTP